MLTSTLMEELVTAQMEAEEDQTNGLLIYQVWVSLQVVILIVNQRAQCSMGV